jgi:hypothetical protein
MCCVSRIQSTESHTKAMNGEPWSKELAGKETSWRNAKNLMANNRGRLAPKGILPAGNRNFLAAGVWLAELGRKFSNVSGCTEPPPVRGGNWYQQLSTHFSGGRELDVDFNL